MRKLIPFLLILSALTLSCQTQNYYSNGKSNNQQIAQADSVFTSKKHYEYVIRKDDKISISVWGQDEWSVGSTYGIYNSNEAYGKWLLVDARGQIEIPKIGTLLVENYTIPQLKDTLKNVFSKWIVNPVVDVKVLNKQITVLGEVRNPGILTVDKDNTPLHDVIAKTGGNEVYANLKQVKVIRKLNDTLVSVQFDLTKSVAKNMAGIELHPGDVVILNSRKSKTFDKRIAVIIPFATAITAATLLLKLF